MMKQLFYSLYTYHRRSLPRSLFLITIITILSVQYKEIPDKTIQENLLHYLQILDLILLPSVHIPARESLHGGVSETDALLRNYDHFCSPLAKNTLTYSYSKLFVNMCIVYFKWERSIENSGDFLIIILGNPASNSNNT